MITTISLADRNGTDVTLHETSTRCVTRATGLLGGGVAAPRSDARRIRPQGHGGIDPTKYTDGKIITLDMEVTGSTYAAVESDYRTIASAIQDTLDHGAAWLKWTEGDSGGTTLALQRLVKAMAEVDAPLEGGAKMVNFIGQFFSEDPRAFSQTEQTATGVALSDGGGGGLTFPFTFPFKFAESSGGTVSPVNAGTKPTPPIFRLYGYALNPAIVNLGTGERLQFGGSVSVPSASVATGNYLEIDVQNRTIYLNGDDTVNQRNLFNPAASTWFELAANATTNIQLTAQDFDASARVDVIFRSAY